MRTKTPQELGREFEQQLAELFHVEPQKGSGNVWYARMDVADGSILWTCKLTLKNTLTISAEVMRECEEAVIGHGGVGGKTIPGHAGFVDGRMILSFYAEDFLRLANSGEFKYISPTKAQEKRARSKVPSLLRDDDG